MVRKHPRSPPSQHMVLEPLPITSRACGSRMRMSGPSQPPNGDHSARDHAAHLERASLSQPGMLSLPPAHTKTSVERVVRSTLLLA